MKTGNNYLYLIPIERGFSLIHLICDRRRLNVNGQAQRQVPNNTQSTALQLSTEAFELNLKNSIMVMLNRIGYLGPATEPSSLLVGLKLDYIR